MDALGFRNKINACDRDGLLSLWDEIDRQYVAFRAKLPNRVALQIGSRIFGTREFRSLRLNDMFVLHSGRGMPDPALRFLVAASILYQQMLVLGYIPRGGLGFGDIVSGEGLLIGSGFTDAYCLAEERSSESRNVCAIQVSPKFLATIGKSRRAMKLLCFYEGHFFLHPYRLLDSELGTFDASRVLDCLTAASTNEAKFLATKQFLLGFEDYEAASEPNSRSHQFISDFQRKSNGADEGV
ncbi:hypothetical protein BBJ66_18085 [Rhizobium sp. RSm-3]|nr:hypothetical protein BBJ66_18085 [Rhizobium sp. RSm-3]